MIVVDIIKVFEDREIYAMNKMFYRENNISMTSSLYLAKETAQAVIDGIVELSEKLDVDVKVRWIYPSESKIFYSKGGVNDE